MADEPISVELEVVLQQVRRLLETEPPLRSIGPEYFAIWDEACIPEDFQAQTAQTLHRMLITMDQTLAVIRVIAQAILDRVESASEAERESMLAIGKLMIFLEKQRDEFTRTDLSRRINPGNGPQA